MSTWDYGQAEQVAEEWDAAVKAGKCHLCLIRPANGRYPCDKCEDEIAEARYQDDGR